MSRRAKSRLARSLTIWLQPWSDALDRDRRAAIHELAVRRAVATDVHDPRVVLEHQLLELVGPDVKAALQLVSIAIDVIASPSWAR